MDLLSSRRLTAEHAADSVCTLIGNRSRTSGVGCLFTRAHTNSSLCRPNTALPCTQPVQGAHRHLLVYLVQEGPPNEPGPDQANAEGQRGEVEAAVHRTQCAHGVLLVDQHGDIVLAAALRYGPASTMALLITKVAVH